MDLYGTLGINKQASQDEIKKAYRKLAKEYHPDVIPGKEDKFKEISKAYEILSNPDKRKQYDDPGIKWFDILDVSLSQQMFNMSRSEDINIIQELTVEEALKGCKKLISYERLVNGKAEQTIIYLEIPSVSRFTSIIVKNMGNIDKDKNIPGLLNVSIDINPEGTEFQISNLDIIWEKKIHYIHFLKDSDIKLDFLGRKIEISLKAPLEAGHVVEIPGKGFRDTTRIGRKGKLVIKLIPDFNVTMEKV